jgi:hypothetical protein
VWSRADVRREVELRKVEGEKSQDSSRGAVNGLAGEPVLRRRDPSAAL